MLNHSRFFRSFGYAIEGIAYVFKHDQNIRIHVLSAIIVIWASLLLHVSPFEMGILGVMILLVIVVEMINTALEKMVDLITKEHHEEAKIAKDVASGMVLVTAVGSVIVAILIFTPYVHALFKQI